jgi:glutathione S-transferase
MEEHSGGVVRLITIPISHYCEKVRWALARLDLPYHEERHLQGFHYPRTFWVSRGPSVPVLVDGGKVISDSTDILKHLDNYASVETRLYPTDSELRRQVEALEDLFDQQLGDESRRWLYFHYIDHPRAAIKIAAQGVPQMECTLGLRFFPLLKTFIRVHLHVSKQTVTSGLGICREIVRQTDALLADGRKYLVGDKFSAADLTLACMMAPLVLPSQYGIQLPSIEEVPAGMKDTVQEFQASLTGRFALHLFATERQPKIQAYTSVRDKLSVSV